MDAVPGSLPHSASADARSTDDVIAFGGDLSLNFTLLPQYLSNAGWQTHLVGKWHLGYSTYPYTPLRRGFDSTFGYLGGAQDYWLHGFAKPEAYLDFCENNEPVFNHTCWNDDACGVEYYSTHLFARRAIAIINAAAARSAVSSIPREPGSGASANSTGAGAAAESAAAESAAAAAAAAPLFLYIAWQSVHSVEGPDPQQLKAPQSYIDAFKVTIPNMDRRVFAAMTTTLDEGVGTCFKRTSNWVCARVPRVPARV